MTTDEWDVCAEEDTIQMLALMALSAVDVLLLQKTLLLACCTILVLAMAIGAAVFYLGPPRAWAAGIVPITAVLIVAVWVLCGYGLVFGPALVPGFLGNPFGAFTGMAAGGAATLHGIAFAAFQAAVAILTVTIVSVVAAGRVRIGPWLMFAALWLVLVYSPIAYSVFNMSDGWIFSGLEVNDQAGGLVVQVCAGATALAVLVVLGRARHLPPERPMPAVLGGVALLWVGAFGLNVGSEGVVDGLLGAICLNTLLAPAVAAAAWSVVEVLRDGRPTLRGAASGVVAGIAAITPACNILTPVWTVLLGLLAGAICAALVARKRKTGVRPGTGLAVAGIHLVGGALGLGYIGLFATGIGWKDTGQPDGLADQFGAAIGVAAYAFVLAFLIALMLRRPAGLRSSGSGKEGARQAVGLGDRNAQSARP